MTKVWRLLKVKPGLVHARTDAGCTPLHYAAALNHAGLAKLLLKKGADINAKTRRGFTPLHWAAMMNADDVAALLTDRGADISQKTPGGLTQLQLAIRRDADSVAKVLVTRTPSTYTDRFLDTYFAEGKEAVKTGDLQQVYETLTDLLRENPGDERINFAYGLACYSLKDNSRAQLAFERVLNINPANGRARLELAQIYLITKQLPLAKREFETVLAGNPPPAVRRNIEGYLTAIRKGMKRWRFSARIDAGYFQDDNVNVGPDSDIISIAPIVFGSLRFTQLTLNEKSKPVKADGYFASLAMSSTYDAGDTGNWLVTAGGSLYQNRLADEPDHESGFYEARLGLKHTGSRSIFQLPVKASYIAIGDKSLLNMYGVNPLYLYVSGKTSMQWLTDGAAEFRDYTELDDRDGVYLSLGETMRYFFGAAKHNVSLGFSVAHDFTDAGVYEYTGKAWKIGGAFKFPRNVTLYSRIQYTTSDYKERETLAPEKRSDTQHQFTVGVNKMITPRCGIDVNFQQTDNNSTFGLYQYDRNVTTLTTFFTF